MCLPHPQELQSPSQQVKAQIQSECRRFGRGGRGAPIKRMALLSLTSCAVLSTLQPGPHNSTPQELHHLPSLSETKRSCRQAFLAIYFLNGPRNWTEKWQMMSEGGPRLMRRSFKSSATLAAAFVVSNLFPSVSPYARCWSTLNVLTFHPTTRTLAKCGHF